MSIATEIQRLSQAKTDLKEVIEKRGIQLEDDVLISEYPQIVDNLPYAVNGSLTPEEDTNIFALSGLNFTPTGVLLSCTELQAAKIAGGVYSGFLYKGEESAMCYFNKSTGNPTLARIGSQATMLQWSDNGVQVTFPSGVAVLKKGYTYKYIVVGGKS